MKKTSVEKHFDEIAAKYDYFKKRNWYYYDNLKKLYRELVLPEKSILEVGCGTGDLVAALKAKRAMGIDISSEMITIAKKKHQNVFFEIGIMENFRNNFAWDYVILDDVIEHLDNIESSIEALCRICDYKKGTQVIFSYANPFWEPILLILEKLHLKMPEGPHYRIPYHKFNKILKRNDFVVLERGWRLIWPAYVPCFSDFINRNFYLFPIIRRLGMLEYIIIKKK